MALGFLSYAWNPVLIVCQMVLMQCIFYGSSGLWLAGAHGRHASLDHVLGYDVVGFATAQGWLSLTAFVLNALTCAVGLWVFVRRVKQCLDFSVAVHFLHFIGCWAYNDALPGVSWWVVNVFCMLLMAVVGEYLCMRTELRAIPRQQWT